MGDPFFFMYQYQELTPFSLFCGVFKPDAMTFSPTGLPASVSPEEG
jgi:hypothetical protein